MSALLTIQRPAHNFVIRDNNQGLALSTLRKNLRDEAFEIFVTRHSLEHGDNRARIAEVGEPHVVQVTGLQSEALRAMELKDDISENAVGELGSVQSDGAGFEQLPGNNIHESTSRADFDNRTMAEAGGESISARGGRAWGDC